MHLSSFLQAGKAGTLLGAADLARHYYMGH